MILVINSTKQFISVFIYKDFISYCMYLPSSISLPFFCFVSLSVFVRLSLFSYLCIFILFVSFFCFFVSFFFFLFLYIEIPFICALFLSVCLREKQMRAVRGGGGGGEFIPLLKLSLAVNCSKATAMAVRFGPVLTLGTGI